MLIPLLMHIHPRSFYLSTKQRAVFRCEICHMQYNTERVLFSLLHYSPSSYLSAAHYMTFSFILFSFSLSASSSPAYLSMQHHDNKVASASHIPTVYILESPWTQAAHRSSSGVRSKHLQAKNQLVRATTQVLIRCCNSSAAFFVADSAIYTDFSALRFNLKVKLKAGYPICNDIAQEIARSLRTHESQ